MSIAHWVFLGPFIQIIAKTCVVPWWRQLSWTLYRWHEKKTRVHDQPNNKRSATGSQPQLCKLILAIPNLTRDSYPVRLTVNSANWTLSSRFSPLLANSRKLPRRKRFGRNKYRRKKILFYCTVPVHSLQVVKKIISAVSVCRNRSYRGLLSIWSRRAAKIRRTETHPFRTE